LDYNIKHSKKTIIPHKKYEIIAFYYFFNFRTSSKAKTADTNADVSHKNLFDFKF